MRVMPLSSHQRRNVPAAYPYAARVFLLRIFTVKNSRKRQAALLPACVMSAGSSGPEGKGTTADSAMSGFLRRFLRWLQRLCNLFRGYEFFDIPGMALNRERANFQFQFSSLAHFQKLDNPLAELNDSHRPKRRGENNKFSRSPTSRAAAAYCILREPFLRYVHAFPPQTIHQHS